MFGLNSMETVFVVTAFLFQIVLIVHFALRKRRFQTAIRYGPLVYALGAPALLVSLILMLNGAAWFFWISGLLYAAWGLFGYIVEYRRKIEWRSPARWGIFVPYILLYLSTIMFYWFPLARIARPLWFAYGVLFLISTALNVTSHQGPKAAGQGASAGRAGPG